LGGGVATLMLLLMVCSQQRALAASSPGAFFDAGGASLVPYIINGQEASISQFPWQVSVQSEFEEKGKNLSTLCGGSILDSTHILTAAHCVDVEGTTTTHPAEDFVVVAGDSDINGLSSATQVRGVAGIRTHPYYTVLPDAKDDVAILTLKQSLELSPEKNTQAIPLIQAGATPAPGTTLSVSGYGKEEGADGEGHGPTGKLYSTALTAIGSDACRDLVGVNSAVLLCAESSSSATCKGDSGGPLTEGSPAVQVGIVDFGLKECPVGKPAGFSNLAAPEIRAFIDGSESPPIAARPTSLPAIRSVGPVPVDFGPLTCEPGAWNGSPSFTYTFQVENDSAQVLQSGPSNAFTPPLNMVGVPLVCIVQAGNPGGVTTLRSATTPPIAVDTTPPIAGITRLRCHLRACTLSLSASDPNGVALSLRPSASYSVLARCPRRKGRPARKTGCHKTRTVKMSLKTLSARAFQATVSKLPYGRKLTFSVQAGNAAGLKARTAIAHTTLHKPKSRRGSTRKR
jgi:Trypsin